MTIKNRLYTMGIALLSLLAFGCTSSPENGPQCNVKEQNLSLNGKWSLSYWKQNQDEEALCPKAVKPENTIKATVPGNTALDMQNAGIVDKLEFGMNAHQLRKFEGYEFMYERSFKAPKLKDGQKAILNFEGVDCLAKYFLNGEKIGESDNAFIAHSFDVTKLIKQNGYNHLQVILSSPMVKTGKHFTTAASSGNDVWKELNNGIRRPAHSYGWDILPRIICTGLWRDVSLQIQNPVRIKDIFVMVKSVNLGNKTAQVMVDTQISAPFDEIDNLTRRVSVSVDGKCVHQLSMAQETYSMRDEFTIGNAKFWWPRGYGDQTLYNFKVELLDKNGKVVAQKEVNTGLRTIDLICQPVEKAKKNGEFRFKVNGRDIYIKGTNWVPVDSLHSRDSQLIKPVLEMLVDTNCNMVRCWGGNIYECDEFYDFCDKNGILIWQDFAMGCSMTPQNDEFAKAIEKEAKAVVIRLRNHPSLALWSGNNENDMFINWSRFNDPNSDRISRTVLPRVIFDYDPFRPYLPSSPYYSPEVFKDRKNFAPSETHLWGGAQYMEAPFYTNSLAHFVSEIGYHGCPNMETLKKMFGDKTYPWGKNDFEWNDFWQFKVVQPLPTSKAFSHRNKMMHKEFNIFFGDKTPRDLQAFVDGSQIVQAESLKRFVELWRSERPYRTGILWWNMRDGWPVISDAVVDYYNSKKLAYYYLKRSQQDQLVLINRFNELLAVNDSFADKKGKAKVFDVESGKVLYEGEFTIPANGRAVLMANLPKPDAKEGIILIEYTIEGQSKKLNHFLYGKPPFSLEKYMANMKALKIDRQ